jgi:hypothetical protein
MSDDAMDKLILIECCAFALIAFAAMALGYL